MAEDVIDLTEDSPIAPAGPAADRKRTRSPEVVELDAGEEEDAAAKERIMAFAKRARTGGGARTAPANDGAPTAPAGERAGGQGDGPVAKDDEEQAKRRIMEFAKGVNEKRGVSAAAAGGAGPQRPAAAAGAPSAEAALAPPVTNSLLAQLHAERLARQQRAQQQHGDAQAGGTPQRQQQQAGSQGQQQQQGYQEQQQQQPAGSSQGQQQRRLTLISYNVWFAEDVAVEARMAAVAGCVAQHRPDFLCLQEVTPLILRLLSGAAWWHEYGSSPLPPGAPYFTVLLWRKATVQRPAYASIPFNNSQMGRDLKSVAGEVAGLQVRVATSHLESPTGWNQLWSEARRAQCKQAGEVLDASPQADVLFVGDMNWNERNDDAPPLPRGWVDAWLQLHPGDPGLTYDAKANPMLKPNSRLRLRLDRLFCKLRRWQLERMERLGMQALPGLRYEGRPVLPSDHFGLLIVLRGSQ